MIVLAIDTCLGACSAAVIDGEKVLAAESEAMWRGHQERLGSLVAQTMKTAKIPYAALERVGATVGPGSFTGLRVGVAFAKGLSVALDIPAVGVGTLEAFAIEVPGHSVVVADARRGQVYWQSFVDGSPATPPAVSFGDSVLNSIAAPGRLESEFSTLSPKLILGPGAALLSDLFPDAEVRPTDAADPVAVARLAAAAPLAPIQPLYLRPPDAKLPGGIDPFAA